MPVPQNQSKYEAQAVLTPEANEAYAERIGLEPDSAIPETAFAVFDDGLSRWVRDQYDSIQLDGFVTPVYRCETDGDAFLLVSEFGLGAPAMTLVLEEVIQAGVERVVAVGHVGALQPEIDVGDVVLCDKALRDEGTSHHYLPDERFVEAPGEFLSRCLAVLRERMDRVHVGPCWSTDAPYRETGLEVRSYRAEGILCVEMETAALFAVATFREVEAAAAFVVSDIVTPNDWNPQFHRIESRKRELLESLSEGLLRNGS